MEAARNGHFNVVKYLVENGADSKDDSYNAFKWAVHNKHKQIAQYLAQYVPEHMRKFANF